jgi:hypothetical protein
LNSDAKLLFDDVSPLSFSRRTKQLPAGRGSKSNRERLDDIIVESSSGVRSGERGEEKCVVVALRVQGLSGVTLA